MKPAGGMTAGLALRLARASNLPTVWGNGLTALVLTQAPFGWGTALVLLGGTLVYAGGCTLNDAFDAAWDARHRPDRPIPSGRVTRRAVAWLGGVELALGAGCLLLAGALAWVVAGLVGVILLYDWCHKRTAWAVVPMGLCRVAFAAAAATVGGAAPPPLLALWLLALFAHVTGLTLVARAEATHGRTSWPGAALVLLPGVAALGVPALGAVDFRSTLFGLFLWGLWLREVWLTLRESDEPPRIGRAVAQMLAGIVTVDFLFAAQFSATAAVVLAALFVLALQWQKRVAAT